MKPIDEKKPVTAPNAWGRDATTYQQTFEVEEADIGRAMGDYGGHSYSSHTFSRADVGRQLIICTAPDIQRDSRAYRCWHFTMKAVTP